MLSAMSISKGGADVFNSVPQGIYGLAAMAIGILFLLFGIRLFRLVVATSGFIVGSLLSYVVVLNLLDQHPQMLGSRVDMMTFIICVCFGIVGSLLALSAWNIALVGIGALAGFTSAMFLLSWSGSLNTRLLLDHPSARPIVIVLLTALGGALAALYERALIIVATSIVGAVVLCSGVDVFAETGFNRLMQMLLKSRGQNLKLPSDGGVYALLVSCAAAALLGIVVQSTATGRKTHN